jgi:N-acetylmuramoyl-L-alanine amidase
MLRAARFLFPVFLLLVSATAWGQEVLVQNLRVWRAPDHTRLVFDLTGPVEHRLFTLQNPNRVVIDMDNARLQGKLADVDTGGPLLGDVRVG